MALDSVNNRLFIPAYGNGGYRSFQLNDEGRPVSRAAQSILSRQSLYGRRSNPQPSAREAKFPGAISIFDNTNQRLIALDRFNNRILIYPAGLDVTDDFPEATVIIGQPDFNSTVRGIGPNRFGMVMNAALDEEQQRLFVADMMNHRVLVFDIHPERVGNEPSATFVIGQKNFMDRSPGIGPDRLSRPVSVTYDPDYKRLFISDSGNHRVLIFDADPENPKGFEQAISVMGQPDFDSRIPRQSLDQIHPETLSYDWRYHRLFIAEDLNHRILVFDAHPDRVGGPATALAVIGQPDTETTHPAVDHNRLAMPRLTVDPISQKLFVSEGFPAGNRISIWNISPEKLKTGMSAEDVLGHETPAGEPDFKNRMAQGHLDGTSLAAPRDVLLDPVDHRLFVGDEYNHRVVVWQLDDQNRIIDHEAKWVLGQPDLESSFMGEPSASNVTVPIALAYDTSTKRLFVGDGYHNRVLVYDTAPGELQSGMSASVVIGQDDFISTERQAGKAGINFGIRMGRGIASSFIPMGLEVDEEGQRLFISDGENNRIVVHDIRPNVLKNGSQAIGVLGQTDFDKTAPQPGAMGLHDPGHMAFDPEYQRLFAIDSIRKRVLVFDVDPSRFVNGALAIAVLGKPDLETPEKPPTMMMPGMASEPEVNGKVLVSPNGIDHDPIRQHLYVSDGGGTFNMPADRVLVFNVDPDKLKNGDTAFAALGALNPDTPAPSYFGGSGNYPGQFTIRDTRGISIDPVYGRLFTTGSFESRIVAFHFPREVWQYQLQPGALKSYGTLDAIDIGFRWDTRSHTSMTINAERRMPAVQVLYSRTEPFVDERSERHSRILVSEAAVSSLSTKESVIFIEADSSRQHRIVIHNTSARKTGIDLNLIDIKGSGLNSTQYSLKAHEQVSIVVEELGWDLPDLATLHLKASRSVSLTALRETENSRGEMILSPAPQAGTDTHNRSILSPLFINGGHKRSSLVLINNQDEPIQGSISFYNQEGTRTNLGTTSDFMGYYIPPKSVRHIVSDGAGPVPVNGYAAIVPQGNHPSPQVSALVITRHGDVWTSEASVTSTLMQNSQYAINHRPTPIRHGITSTQFTIVNPGTREQSITLSMHDEDIFEHEIAPGAQMTFSLDDTVTKKSEGIVTVTSEQPVYLTVHQLTQNLRGEKIETELPVLNSDTASSFIVNGEGLSTEIRMGNLTNRVMAGEMEYRNADNSAAEHFILR